MLSMAQKPKPIIDPLAVVQAAERNVATRPLSVYYVADREC